MKTKTITLVAIAAVGAVIAGYIYFLAIVFWGVAISDKLWYLV